MKKEILVTGYVGPDLDGVASTFAYSNYLNKIGEKAIPCIFSKHHEEVDYLINKYNLNLNIQEYDPTLFSKIILVDASEIDTIDKRIDPNKVVEIIDHRKINMVEKFPNAKIQIEMVGAAATLITEKFIKNNISFSEDLAILLYGAIVSNTLNFKAKVTTDRDIKAVEYLKNNFHFPEDFAHEMFMAKSDYSGEKLRQALKGNFANFKSHNFAGKKMGIIQIEMIDGKKMAIERKDEIIKEIQDMMKELDLDICFLTIIDLEANQNIFVAPNKQIEDLLSKVLNVEFKDYLAIRPGFIMRKEIVPLVKEELIK